jgi:hypothetical protein
MCVTIPLSNSGECLVDKDDYFVLSKYTWYRDNYGYVVSKIYDKKTKKCSTIRMHRMIMGVLSKKNVEIDHINHNGLDNRKENLRVCTSSQNSANTRKRSDNSSGYKGVHWHKQCKLWRAQISVNKKMRHIGLFKEPREAAKAYNEAAIKYFGGFAHVNKL